MVNFDIGSIKTTFMNSIRTYVYPQQTSYDSSISVLSEGTIVQPCYLFSDTISNFGIYVSNTIGSPSGLTIELKSGNSSVYSSTVPGTVGWNIVSYATTDLVTARSSSVVITGDVSAGNDYFIGKDSTISYFMGQGLNTFNVAFTIGIRDFVYKVFNEENITQNKVPIIAVDVVGRPKVVDRYLTGDHTWFYINVRADVYGHHTQEIDKLVYGMGKGINKDKRLFEDIQYITPGMISQLSYVRPEIYNRNIVWTIQQLVTHT